jgi:hypothetical protein
VAHQPDDNLAAQAEPLFRNPETIQRKLEPHPSYTSLAIVTASLMARVWLSPILPTLATAKVCSIAQTHHWHV